MKKSIFSAVISVGLMSFVAGTSFAETTTSSAIQDIKTRVFELIGKDTATIAFAPGRSTITDSERKNLAAVVAAVRADSTINSAVVASWADKEYPATKGQKLGKKERDLADARNKAINEALLGLGVNTVETHTMAEHPTWFATTFNTNDSKVKGEGKVEDANDQVIAEIGRVLREKGGAGKGVVIIRRAGAKAAH